MALLGATGAGAVPVSWTNAASSFWDIATNWSGGILPGAADDVTLGLAGARTVTYRTATTSINSLAITGSNLLAVTGGILSTNTLANSATINIQGGRLNVGSGNSGTLNLSSGTLGLTGVLTATGAVTLSGGTITGGTVVQSGANALVFTASTSTLDGVTVRGALNIGDAANPSGRVRISNGLVVQTAAGGLPGVVNVGTVAGATGAVIGFTGTQSFDNATINLGAVGQNALVSFDGGGAFTLGSSGVIQGAGGVGQAQFVGGTSNFVNNGLVSSNLSGRTLTVNNSGTLSNAGTLEARNGATLTLAAGGATTNTGLIQAVGASTLNLNLSNFTNSGTLRLVDATSVLNISGSFTTAGLGTIDNANSGSVTFTSASLNNTGATFNAATVANAPVRLLSSTITGGTVVQSGANALVFTASTSTLDGVTVRGALNIGDAANPSGRVRISNGLVVQTAAGGLPGVVNVGTVAGATGAVIGFTGTQSFDNATINLGNATQNGIVSLDAGGTFTLGSGAVVQGSGNFGGANFVGGTNNLVNNGTVSANLSGRLLGINNSGTLINNGMLEARNGALLTLQSQGGFTNFSGNTLTGGTLRAVGASIVQFAGANIVNNAAAIQLDGAGSTIRNSTNSADALLGFVNNTSGGSFAITGGRNFTTSGAFTNAGTLSVGSGSTFATGAQLYGNVAGSLLSLAGGSFGATASFTNAGTVSGFGSVAPAIANAGTVTANGGTLTLTGGVQGSAGTVSTATGATLSLAAGSSSGTLALSGTLLALGGNDITVFGDYTNSGFGSGNAFNARAGVSGSGRILGNNASVGLAGDAVANGSNTWVLAFGTVRGGNTANRSFQVVNTGSGAALRGAVQTGAPGLGSITDPRLTGSGVTAANFGALAAGSGSTLNVSFAAGSGSGTLSGQSVAIVSNFDNVARQTLVLTGAATTLATGQLNPAGLVTLANFRVGGASSGASLSANNLAAPSATAEQLGISGVSTTGNFTAVNALGTTLLNAGAGVPGAVMVATSAGVAGVNTGSVTAQFVTNGGLIDSAFVSQAANSQTVNLIATGYRAASASALPSTVTLAAQRVGGTLAQALPITNTALADAFSEKLNATATASGAAQVAGSVSLLNPQAISNAITVGVNTSTAGNRSGVVTVAIASDGTGTSGLAPLNLASQTVNVQGQVFAPAVAAVVTPTLNFGIVRVGSTVAPRSVTVRNDASGALTDSLAASLSGAPAPFTASGSAAGIAAGASAAGTMQVRLTTTTAGIYTGQAALQFTSSNGVMSDLALGGASVVLLGQVNNLAAAALGKTGGAGSFSNAGSNAYTLDFGTLLQGAAATSATLILSNSAAGPADALAGSFDLATLAGSVFSTTGFASFSGLAAGSQLSPLTVTFTPGQLGGFDRVVTLNSLSTNAANPDLALASVSLRLLGTVSAVPEPGSWALLLAGGLAVAARARRRTLAA